MPRPPKILLIRGRAELDVVEGIPEEYLQTNGTYEMTPEQRVEWEAEVRQRAGPSTACTWPGRMSGRPEGGPLRRVSAPVWLRSAAVSGGNVR
jgi:hypothetical protein